MDFYGNFYMANTTDVEMSSIDSDSTVCLEVKHDDKLSEAEGAYVQVILLLIFVCSSWWLMLPLNQKNWIISIIFNLPLSSWVIGVTRDVNSGL